MICPPCRRAGMLNMATNEATNNTDKRANRKAAIAQHDICQGCDCQHRVGKWITKGTDTPK